KGEDDPRNEAPIIHVDDQAPRGYLLDTVCCRVTPTERAPGVIGAAGFHSREVMGRERGRLATFALFGFDCVVGRNLHLTSPVGRRWDSDGVRWWLRFRPDSRGR